MRQCQALSFPGRFIHRVEIYPSLDSTNEWAKHRVRSGVPSGTVIWTYEQTAGRGRRGRSWLSHTGSLTFSVIWRLPADPQAPQLSLMVGLWVAQALLGDDPKVRVKWPNDLWIGMRKLGGVLGEGMVGSRLCPMIIGVGLNINGPTPPPLKGIGISLEESTGRSYQLQPLLWQILRSIDQGMARYLEGDIHLNQEFRRYGNFLGHLIVVCDGQHQFLGIAKAVQPNGALVVSTDQGEVTVSSGEVSLRWPERHGV